MGNEVSRSDSDNEKEFDEKPEVAPPPLERRTEPDIVENVEASLDEDNFKMGVESDFDTLQATILQKSKEEGKTYVFRDNEFPAEASSLHYSSRPPPMWNKVEWKTTKELSRKPRLLEGGISKNDILQGSLGNCWWLSSCAAITRKPEYMRKVIPKGQGLAGRNFVGMAHFRFWRFGSWVDVIVDDLLPTLYGNLVFGRSSDPDEFWLPLLEKAYAKLHGSYQAIEGGYAQDALEDLTGGMAVTFDLGDKTPPFLFMRLAKTFRHHSFACASIKGSSESVDKSTGLVNAHGYTVTGARRVMYKGTRVNLVRIRNPWGNEVEWKGNWSDGSHLWDEIDPSIRKRLRYADKHDGEWWMDFEDFKNYFTDITICTLGPDFDSDGAPSKDRWLLSMVKGKWLRGHSAGGSRNNISKFATNPQYYLRLKSPDDFNPKRDAPEEEGKCSVVMGLMQEYRRVGKSKGLKNLFLGLTLYKLKAKPSRRLEPNYFRYHREAGNSGTYTNLREVSLTAELEPGHYVIIPATFHADKPGSFLIRIFTEKEIDLEEL